MLSRIKYKLILSISGINSSFYNIVVKRINAIKFALKNKDKYCSWDLNSSSIELLFSQFKDFYEMSERKFSDEMILNLYDELEYFIKIQMDKETISDFRKQIKKDEKYFIEIRNIYKYITYSRIKNEEKFQEILDTYLNPIPKYNTNISKKLNMSWEFDNTGLANVKWTNSSIISYDLYDFEDACIDKDTEMAKKILDLRSYFID